MRKIGTILAALFASTGTALVVFLIKPSASGWHADGWPWVLVAVAAAIFAWVGVWAWTQDRYWLAAGGAWAALYGSVWLWSAALLPLLFAITTTVLALMKTFGRDRRVPD